MKPGGPLKRSPLKRGTILKMTNGATLRITPARKGEPPYQGSPTVPPPVGDPPMDEPTHNRLIKHLKAKKPRQPLRPVTKNAERRKRDAVRRWGPKGYREWLRARGCIFARTWAWHHCEGQPVQIAHLKTRGAGNGFVDADGRPNLLPMDPHMHAQTEGRALVFGVQNDVDLFALAAEEKRVWDHEREGA